VCYAIACAAYGLDATSVLALLACSTVCKYTGELLHIREKEKQAQQDERWKDRMRIVGLSK
jgi:hypothetical protein